MDDRRFDSLAKSLAGGASRRSVLKGLLGLGGAALTGSVVLEGDGEAARRPTNPTPTPVKCPGQQTPCGSTCCCPATAPNKCGPDCCTGLRTDPYPRPPTHSECGDNECCFGTYLPEEFCCPTNTRAGGLPPLAAVCSATNECCFAPSVCCAIDGCCDTFCYGGPLEESFCCPAAQVCPGGDASDDNCCDVDERCCGAGTNSNQCIPDVEGSCCADAECTLAADACFVTCTDGLCVQTVCGENFACCDEQCLPDDSVEPCGDGCCSIFEECCAGQCCTGTCLRPPMAPELCCTTLVCGAAGGPQECCPSAANYTCCGESCCPVGQCTTAGECCGGDNIVCVNQCCPEERCTAGVGCCPEGFLACSGGICCSAAIYQCSTTGPGCECLPGTEACGLLPGGCCPEGQCNQTTGDCCDPGTTPCGSVCCDDATQACSAEGICECNEGLIDCSGTCVAAQCCPNDTSACEALGYDAACVVCAGGVCTESGTEFLPCSTPDVADGWCNNGHCVGCLANDQFCDQSSQCCSNNCVQGTCQFD